MMMVRLMFAGWLLAGSLAAYGAAPPGAAKAAKQGQSLPDGAEKVREGVWRHKDASGKVWLYHATPFGYAKQRENEVKQEPAATTSAPPLRVVSESADSVQFERETPFGKSKWTRKKTELNDDEKAALEQKHKPQAPSAKDQR